MKIFKAKKKPIVVDAIQFTSDNFKEIVEFTNGYAKNFDLNVGIYTCIIKTLEGQHIASENDYIIKGVKGEFYPCKPDVFLKTYEILK